MEFTHLLFWVTDNTLSVKFYKKLGFTVICSDDEYSEVECKGLTLGLITMRDEAEFAGDALASERGKGVYAYMRTVNVDEWHAELTRRGVTPHTAPRDWPWGNREFIVQDPDGYKLCFWQSITSH